MLYICTPPSTVYYTTKNNTPELREIDMDQIQGEIALLEMLSRHDRHSAQNSMLVASLCLKQFGLLSPTWSDSHHHHFHHRLPSVSAITNETASAASSSTLLMPQAPINSQQASTSAASSPLGRPSDEPKFNFHKLAESATKDKIKKKSRPKKEYICRYFCSSHA